MLDTHAALWWLGDDSRLGANAARALTDATNRVFLSSAVVWEVAIKRSLGKLRAPADFVDVLIGAGVSPLSITVEHAAAVESLPLHHRDPFDRMLVAQASIERCTVATHDDALRAYGVDVVW